MAKKKESNSSADRKQWKKVFEYQVEKIQLVYEERDFYRDRLISDGNLYKERLSQLESEKTTLQMIQNVDRLKLDMVVSLKKRNDTVHTTKYDSTLGDLKDLKAAFDCVIKEESNATTQIAALKSERDFVWNQYKTMEREVTEKLKSKKTEIGQANDKIMTLLKEVEQLRSLNIEKDSTIRKLKSEMGDLRATAVKNREEIDLLRKNAGNGSATPTPTPSLRGCTVVSSRMRDTDKRIDNRNIVLKIEGNPSGLHEKGTRSSKRNAGNSISISETPKLFSSAFKVPKLKNPSPRSNI